MLPRPADASADNSLAWTCTGWRWPCRRWPRRRAAQGVDLVALTLQRQDGALTPGLQRAAAAVAHRARTRSSAACPIYFIAEAQPSCAAAGTGATSAWPGASRTWRAGLPAPDLHLARGRWAPSARATPRCPEALSAVTRLSGWKLAELSPDRPRRPPLRGVLLQARHTQLPGPMQIGLTGQADWVLRVERTLRVE
jgi:hypothetical protein